MTINYDNSMISTFYQCQLKHELRYKQHRKSNIDRIATDIGTATHECFACHLNGEGLSETLFKWIEIFNNSGDEFATAKFSSAVAALTKAYPLMHDPNGTTLIMYPEIRDQNNNIVRNYSPRWIVRYPEISFQLPMGQVYNETVCSYLGLSTRELITDKEENLDIGEAFNYMGAIDCVVEDGNQQLFILELKTSARANEQWWKNKWRLDSQPIGYVYSVTEHLSKIINGAVIIPIWVGKTYSKMTPEIELKYTPNKLQNWKEETLAKAQEVYNSAGLPTGRSAGSCSSSYLGTCDYFNYCYSDYNNEILMQETHFDEWSPLKAIKERS